MSNLINYNTSDGIELLVNHVTGECFASQNATARMCDVSKTTISKFLSARNINAKKIKATTKGGTQLSNSLDISIVLDFMAKYKPSMIKPTIEYVYAVTGLRVACPNMTMLDKGRRKIKRPEKSVQRRLAKQLDGKIEVLCKTGAIDVLTETEVIEVKKVIQWKHAIGQVLVYQLEYPQHQARIHLYEECSQESKQMIISFSSRLNVVVSFES